MSFKRNSKEILFEQDIFTFFQENFTGNVFDRNIVNSTFVENILFERIWPKPNWNIFSKPDLLKKMSVKRISNEILSSKTCSQENLTTNTVTAINSTLIENYLSQDFWPNLIWSFFQNKFCRRKCLSKELQRNVQLELFSNPRLVERIFSKEKIVIPVAAPLLSLWPESTWYRTWAVFLRNSVFRTKNDKKDLQNSCKQKYSSVLPSLSMMCWASAKFRNAFSKSSRMVLISLQNLGLKCLHANYV